MTLPAQDWPQDWPPEIRRAHRHLLDRDEEDDNLALAQALHLPQNLAERDLMWALLICQDASFEMIADVFNYEAGATQARSGDLQMEMTLRACLWFRV